MKLPNRTEYGLRAMVQLARQDPRAYTQSKDLAQQEGLPAKFLESILLAMRRGGFLESKIGSGGGYRLSRPARDIVVGEIIRKLEDRLSDTHSGPSAEMSPGEAAAHWINERLTEATDAVLDQMTLEQLVDQSARRGGNAMYYI